MVIFGAHDTGDHGVTDTIEAAREANSCDALTCACEGNWAGEFCETECDCNGRGNQTNITAVRAAALAATRQGAGRASKSAARLHGPGEQA